MKTTNNWHLLLTDDQRHDLHTLLDFATELRDCRERFGFASYFAEDILDSLVTITPGDPK